LQFEQLYFWARKDFAMSGISSAMASARRTAFQSVTKFKAAAGGVGAEQASSMAANEDVAPARPDPSVISANTQLAGSITTTDELYIQGKVDGDVSATTVMVCEGGVVRGDITAETITVYGAVTGNLIGGHVLLCEGSVVDGEITHSSLRIDAGANFEGSIKRRTVAAPAPFAAE
jgi:cytoskeletal protein CcmA (bactofilin family)